MSWKWNKLQLDRITVLREVTGYVSEPLQVGNQSAKMISMKLLLEIKYQLSPTLSFLLMPLSGLTFSHFLT